MKLSMKITQDLAFYVAPRTGAWIETRIDAWDR